MEPNEAQPPHRGIASRFRLDSQLRQQAPPRVVNENTSVWEIYNHLALTVDKELIKDWNDSLNTLLIFAALYSAVLTAFIIESMKLIKEDATETTRDILLIITRQLNGTGVGPYMMEEFEAPTWAVRVNYYFFTSLSLSLVAALGSVLALQWVGSYDSGLNQSSPEERALQRHFRHQRVKQWKMGEIIASLPMLIFGALFLFFIGLVEWMWTMHQGVAGILIAGLLFGASLFLVTTILGMINVGVPFRTTISRSLARCVTKIYCSGISKIKMVKVITSSRRRFGDAKSYMIQTWFHPSVISSAIKSIGNYIISPTPVETFQEREKERFLSITDMKLEALTWLANRIEVSPHTISHFHPLIKEILLLPPDQLTCHRIEQAPWDSIFTLLLRPALLAPERDGVFLEEEVRCIEPLIDAFSLVWTIPPENTKFDGLLQGTRSLRNTPVKMAGDFAQFRHRGDSTELLCHLASLIKATQGQPSPFLVAYLRKIRQFQMRESDQSRFRLPGNKRRESSLAYVLQVPSGDIIPAGLGNGNGNGIGPLENKRIPIEALELIIDILALRILGRPPQGDTPIERYSAAMETVYKHPLDVDISHLHDSVISQYASAAVQAYKPWLRNTPGRRNNQMAFETVVRLLQAKPCSMPDVSSGLIRLIENFFPWRSDYDYSDLELTIAQICTLVLPDPYLFDGEDWGEWKTRFYLGLDSMHQQTPPHWLAEQQASNGRNPLLSPAQAHRLSLMKDRSLRVYASSGNPYWAFPSPAPSTIPVTDQEPLNAAVKWWWGRMVWGRRPHFFPSEISFIRNIICTARVRMPNTDYLLHQIQTVDGHAMSSEDWYTLLQTPALGNVLRQCEPDKRLILNFLRRLCSNDWFFHQFTVAGGFRWLAMGNTQLLETAASFICSTLTLTDSEQQFRTVAWIQLIYDHLSARSTLSRPIGIDQLIETVEMVYSKQKKHSNNFQALGDSAIRNASARDDDGAEHSYIRDWTQERWEEWEALMDNLLGGMRRGYLRVGPTQSTIRYHRDPDGLSSFECTIGTPLASTC